MQILTDYYKIKFVVAIGIVICWVLVSEVGCDSSCSSGEISYISVVVSISEALDLYFTYVIYSASILISRPFRNVNRNLSARVEPENAANFTNVHHFDVREGVNIDQNTNQALFERTDLVVALPIDSSLEDVKPPPLSKIRIQDYTKNAYTEEDGNISR